MAEAGTVTVRVKADVNNFTRNMGRVQGMFRKMGGGLRSLASRWRSFGVAIAAVAAGIGLMIRQQAKLGDELGKLSKRTGIAVETLDAYRLGLELSDVKLKDFATAMKTLTKNIGDAAQGTGEAVEWFNMLGISAKNSEGKLRDTHDVMLDFVKAMEDLTRQEKGTLLLDVFGARSGFTMQTFFAGGTKGMNAFLAEGKKLGSWTSEQSAQMEEFNDNIARFKRLLSNFARGIAAEVVPQLDKFIAAMIEGRGTAEIFEAKGRALGRALVWMGKVVKVLYETFQLLWQTWEKGDAVLEFFAIKWQGFIQLILKGQILLSKIPKIGETIFGSTAELQASLDEFERIYTERMKALGIKIQAIVAHELSIGAPPLPPFEVPPITLLRGAKQVFKIPVKLDFSRTGAQIQSLKQQFADIELKIKVGIDEASRQIAERDFREKFKGLGFSEERIQAAMKFMNTEMSAGFKDVADVAKENLEEMNTFAIQAAANMENAFATLFFDAMTGNFNGFMGLLDQVENAVAKLVANMIAQDLAGALFGKNFGSTGQAGGLLGALTGAIGLGSWKGLAFGGNTPTNIPNIAWMGLPKLAEGGIVTKPTVGIVGEAGPEAIIPLKKIQSFGRDSSGPTVINFNINALDSRSFEEFAFENRDTFLDLISSARDDNHQSRSTG